MSPTKFKFAQTFAVLCLIALVALSVRWYRLDQSPKGALIDEAHFGYLAYSLLETGKDEHGVPFPLIFRGFGDQKLPVGAYAMVPVVKFFGLSNLTIRIPSVVAGVALVFIIYWLVRELGFEKKYGYLAAVLMALSPWSFYLSRFGFESNLGLLFFTIGLALLLKGYRTKHWGWLIGSSLSLALTWYSYISYRPVTLALLVVFWVGAWWQSRQKTTIKLAAVSLASLVVMVTPLLIGPAAASNSTRLNQVGIASDPSVALLINENRTFCTEQLPKILCYAIWNKPSVLLPKLVANFARAFAPQFLATEGEGESIFLTIEGFGQFYSVVYPFIAVGLMWLLLSQLPQFKILSKKLPVLKVEHWILISAGLLLAPIPTILVGTPQQVRLSPLLPFLIVVTVTGVALVEKLVTQKLLKAAAVLGLSGIFVFQAISFLVNFYSVHTMKHDYYYQSYLPGLYSFLATLPAETQVYIKPYYSDPLMFYAYYTKMDPARYQAQAVLGELEASGFQHTVGLGNIKTTSDSLEYIGCQSWAASQSAVFVTNEQAPTTAPLIYQEKSTSGVHTFAFVYDVTSKLQPEDCQQQLSL